MYPATEISIDYGRNFGKSGLLAVHHPFFKVLWVINYDLAENIEDTKLPEGQFSKFSIEVNLILVKELKWGYVVVCGSFLHVYFPGRRRLCFGVALPACR